MTNPNNMVRVRARLNGRASVYEANAWAQAFTSGLLDGSGATQNTSADMNVLVGGTTSKPDVVLATNPAGYKIALDIVERQAIAITAPAANSRISSIIAYTDDLSLSSSDEDTTGSPSSCGLIVVNGTSSSSPVATTTTITNSLIALNRSRLGDEIKIDSHSIDFATFDTAPIEAKTVSGPYGLSINLLRTLNLVFYTIFDNPNGIPGSGTSAETIPVGFRPTQDITTVARQDSGEAGRWTVQTDGKANWFLPTAGNSNVTVCLSFPTNDPWPTN